MRIAFVGKGGSGKSTLTACFISYLTKHQTDNIIAFDADLNIHLPQLMGLDKFSQKQYLSHPDNIKNLKLWMKGKNIFSNLSEFRKTTPPTNKSNIINFHTINQSPLANLCNKINDTLLCVVGTYNDNEIGAACYHNNLAIFESILNHFDDKNGYLAADMVAGVDAFAGTLHTQFDLTCLAIEPTKRGLDIYESYKKLAISAGTWDSIYIIGNKIRDTEDIKYICQNIPEEKLIGNYLDDAHVRQADRTGEKLEYFALEKHNQLLLKTIADKLNTLPDNRNERLKNIWKLHKKYISQDFIVKQYGDLSDQIDDKFKFE